MGDNENQQGVNADAAMAQEVKSEQPVMPMFLSSFSHALDAKSRVVVPSVYREGLGKDFVIAPSLDFECIAFYPKAVWEREIQRMYRKAQKSISVGGRILEQFSTLSFPGQECDSQGRCLLPARAKQVYLGDVKEVVIAGRMDYVLIKAQNKAEETDRNFMENKAELLRQMDMIED